MDLPEEAVIRSPPLNPYNKLPPLNPKLPYTISLEVEPSYHKLRYDTKFSEPVFAIHAIVSVRYKSADESNHAIFPALFCKTKFFFPCHVTNLSSRYSSEEIKRNFLDEMYIPFKLDRSFVADCISEVLCSMRHEVSTFSFYNVLPISLEIVKEVELPEVVLKLWFWKYRQYTRLIPDFEKNYKHAIRRPRAEEEVDSGSSSDDDSSCKRSCSICLEELVLGYKNTYTLACSHVFHLDCIWKWKLRPEMGNTCPLCRRDYT